ncbi:zinc-binding dehydrogenase [Phytoactinopolyspora sp. XMNu-373]|uniref:Zinc-binding dehydrogenase n=2 Tax=Phytoactinopolyspora mesophila TaxID=2650750 RepID=A0A7K3MCK4_9ACTN|nr:zinc-binding dehydrogenase [Phytoactinopolyspora mesophila]
MDDAQGLLATIHPKRAETVGADGVAPSASREIRLVSRPGDLSPANLETAVTSTPRPGPGQVLVRNTWLSVDRYVRGRMDNVPAPAHPPYQLGSALDGAAVGEVVTTRSEDIPVGTTVLHFLGWREYAVVDATDALVVDTDLAPAQAYLGVLGIPGLTAYAALTTAATLQPGDVAFIANATTPVGNAAGQIARKLGASEVIGSAGGPEDTLTALEVHGYDLVVDHHAGSISRQLNRLAPDGVDVYVGTADGPLLEAAIETLRTGGRAALVSHGNDSCCHHQIPGPHNLHKIVDKQLSLHGVQIGKHLAAFPDYIRHAAGWLAEGSLYSHELVYHGLDQAPSALVAMERGTSHHDRVLIRLHP